MLIKTGHVIEFNIGEFVYLKMDKEQERLMVVAITLKPCNAVMYGVSNSKEESWCYGMELSYERDILLATTN